MINALSVNNPAKKAALLMSLMLAVIHFRLCVLIGPPANQVFQQWFDFGTIATGTDELIRKIDRLLSLPIPTFVFAGHPHYGMLWPWWVATIINSGIWGLVAYSLFCCLLRFFENRQQLKSADKITALPDKLATG